MAGRRGTVAEMYRRFPALPWLHVSFAVLAAVDSTVSSARAGTPVVAAAAAGVALGSGVFVVATVLTWAWLRYRRRL